MSDEKDAEFDSAWRNRDWDTVRRIQDERDGATMTPRFGEPITYWYRWFAWYPVETADRGLRWLTLVWRRRIEKYDYLDGGPDRWFQHRASAPRNSASHE